MSPSLVDLDRAVSIVGVDPAARFEQALLDVGINSGKPQNGNEHGNRKSRCPAHVDDSPSLSWKKTADGRVVFNCHAGCEGSEVLTALSLRGYELRPTKTLFHYYDGQGTYQATVQKVTEINGGKSMSWVKVDDKTGAVERGLEDDGGIPAFLWLQPWLDEWADAVKVSGESGGPSGGSGPRLWLCEGERDAWQLTRVLEAAAANTAISSEETGAGDFATTLPGGAAAFDVRLKDVLLSVVRRAGGDLRVMVCVDLDPAGLSRGVRLYNELSELGVNVQLWSPNELAAQNGCNDVGTVIDVFGSRWLTMLEECDVERAQVAAAEGTAASGMLLRLVGDDGSRGIWMNRGSRGDKELEPVAVLAGDLTVQAISVDHNRFDVLVKGPYRLVSAQVDVETLTTRQRLETWLATVGLPRIPGSGVNVGDLGPALVAFLTWDARKNGVGSFTSTRHIGWVEDGTGAPCERVSGSGMTWLSAAGVVGAQVGDAVAPVRSTWPGADKSTGLVAIGSEPGAGAGAGADGEDGGVSDAELAAAQSVALLATTADPAIAAVALGWAAQCVLSPWLAEHTKIARPILNLYGAKGIGKTTIANWTGGLSGATGTVAADSTQKGIGQALVAGVGISVVMDDASEAAAGAEVLKSYVTGAGAARVISRRDGLGLVELPRIAGLICTTNHEHVLRGGDLYGRVIHAVPSAVLLGQVDDDGAGDGAENWQDTQHRTSVLLRNLTSDGEGDTVLQWADLTWLQRQWGGEFLPDLAGWFVHGIVGTIGDNGENVGVWWNEAGGAGATREQHGTLRTLVGLRAVVAWLESVRERAGSRWETGGWPVESGLAAYVGYEGVDDEAVDGALESWDWLLSAGALVADGGGEGRRERDRVARESRLLVEAVRWALTDRIRGGEFGRVVQVKEWTKEARAAAFGGSGGDEDSGDGDDFGLQVRSGGQVVTIPALGGGALGAVSGGRGGACVVLGPGGTVEGAAEGRGMGVGAMAIRPDLLWLDWRRAVGLGAIGEGGDDEHLAKSRFHQAVKAGTATRGDGKEWSERPRVEGSRVRLVVLRDDVVGAVLQGL